MAKGVKKDINRNRKLARKFFEITEKGLKREWQIWKREGQEIVLEGLTVPFSCWGIPERIIDATTRFKITTLPALELRFENPDNRKEFITAFIQGADKIKVFLEELAFLYDQKQAILG